MGKFDMLNYRDIAVILEPYTQMADGEIIAAEGEDRYWELRDMAMELAQRRNRIKAGGGDLPGFARDARYTAVGQQVVNSPSAPWSNETKDVLGYRAEDPYTTLGHAMRMAAMGRGRR